MSYTAPADVAWTFDEEHEGTPRVLLAQVPDGDLMVLTGSASQIWLAALESDRLGEVVARVSGLTGASPDEIAPSVADLLDDLVARGLLATS